MKNGRKFFTLLAAVLLGCEAETVPGGKSIDEKAAEGRTKMHQKLVESQNAAISALPKSTAAKTVAAACEKIQSSELSSELSGRCASAHLAVARLEFKNGFAAEGNAALRRAEAEGAPKKEINALADLKKSAEATTAKREKAIHAAAGALVRAALAKQLRQQYLDNNLDIKVSVSGKQNERITLRFALFNDVWANKFRKGDLLAQLQKAGFTRLDMTDGYDYHVYWNLKE